MTSLPVFGTTGVPEAEARLQRSGEEGLSLVQKGQSSPEQHPSWTFSLHKHLNASSNGFNS